METLPNLLRSNGTLQSFDPNGRYNPGNLTNLWLEMLGKRSQHTRKSYERGLRLWLTYCHDHGVHPFEARRADIDDWLTTLGPVAASTWNVRQSAVRAWYRYLSRNGVTDADPVGDDGRREVERDTSHSAYLTPEQIGALLDASQAHAEHANTESAVRDAAILHLLLTTGIRADPVLAGTMDQIYPKGGHRVFGLRNKGGRLLEVVVPPAAAHWMDRYHQMRADRLGIAPDRITGRLFVSAPYRGKRGDQPLRHADLIEMVRRAARRAGIEESERLTTHSTRHSVITALLNAGVPLQEVQYLVGHRDPRTTELYHHGKRRLDASPAYRMAALVSEHSHHPDEEEAHE